MNFTNTILTVLTWLPALGAAVLMFTPKSSLNAIRWMTLVVTLIVNYAGTVLGVVDAVRGRLVRSSSVSPRNCRRACHDATARNTRVPSADRLGH